MEKRDEIIQTAYDIFYKNGFQATGVDKVLANSGISKRTLYKYFRSKEELIAAVVEHYQQILFKKIPEEITKKSSDPKEQILAIFDFKAKEFQLGNFHGCFAINANVEFEGKDKGIQTACSTFYSLFEKYIAKLCEDGGCKDAALTARQIVILFKGSVLLGQMHHDSTTTETAKQVARLLLK